MPNEATPNQVQIAVPVTDLAISKKHTTIVVEPTAAVDGFDSNCYDSAELTTMLWVNNTAERWVEIPIPFPTENFSATISVISAGPDEYEDRLVRIKKVTGDLSRFTPYLQKFGVPNEIIQDKKKLKDLMGGFRIAVINLPARPVVIKIQLSMMIEPVPEDTSRKTYRFRAYAPLPSFIIGPGQVPLKLMVIFKGDPSFKRVLTKKDVSNPFGDNPTLVEGPIDTVIGEDNILYWKWQTDPVVDFEYHYE